MAVDSDAVLKRPLPKTVSGYAIIEMYYERVSLPKKSPFGYF